MQMAQRDVEPVAPNRLRLTCQVQNPDTDLQLSSAARDGAFDDVVELRMFVLLARRSAAPKRRGADDVEPAKPGQAGRDFVTQGKPQAFLIPAVDLTEREDA